MENFLVNLIVLAFACCGAYLLYLGLNSWKIIILSRFWPEISADVRGKLEVKRSERQVDGDYVSSGSGEVTRDGWGDRKLVKLSYAPILYLNYTWKGNAQRTDNKAFWNHKMGYSLSEAQDCIKLATKGPFKIRLNPARPQEIFLGSAHFPWIVSVLWIVIGLPVATGGIGALLKDLAKFFHYQEPLILGDRSVFILVVPVLCIVWLAFELAMSLTAARQPGQSDGTSG